MRPWFLAASAMLPTLLPALALAQPKPRPVVAELFTSEGCSSCPPADAKLAELARTRPDLLVLTFHVTYWNTRDWRDPFSLDAATERQHRYVALGSSPELYTPALVVDGTRDAVGSDDAAVEQALHEAARDRQTAAAIAVQAEPAGLAVSVGAGAGTGHLVLIGYDRLHQTPVGRGENAGRTLTEANIVRSITPLGPWSGQLLVLHTARPAGELAAVLLQDEEGRVTGAATAPPG